MASDLSGKIGYLHGKPEANPGFRDPGVEPPQQILIYIPT
jgi:hypothetical protein